MNATTIAIDLAKDVFEVALADSSYRITQRMRLNRDDFALLPTSPPPATVLMEACAISHYWAYSGFVAKLRKDCRLACFTSNAASQCSSVGPMK